MKWLRAASHPFDVVGWDGFNFPYAFSIHDFEPITGRIHQPPPVHQTFEAQNVYKKQLNVDSRVEWDRQCDRICRNLCIPIGKMLKVFGNIFRVIKYLATLKTHYVIFSLL